MFEVVNDDFVLQIDDTFMTVAFVEKVSLAGRPTSPFYTSRWGSVPVPASVTGKPFFIAMTAYVTSGTNSARNVWRDGSNVRFLIESDAAKANCDLYFFVPQETIASTSNFGLQLFNATGALVFDALIKTLNIVPSSAVPSLLSKGRKLALLSRGLNYSANAVAGTADSRPVSYEFTSTYGLKTDGTVLAGAQGYIAPEYNGSYLGDNYVEIVAPPPLVIDVTGY